MQSIGGRDTKHDSVPIGVGEGSFIKKAIIDKNAKIGKNVKVLLATYGWFSKTDILFLTQTKTCMVCCLVDHKQGQCNRREQRN